MTRRSTKPHYWPKDQVYLLRLIQYLGMVVICNISFIKFIIIRPPYPNFLSYQWVEIFCLVRLIQCKHTGGAPVNTMRGPTSTCRRVLQGPMQTLIIIIIIVLIVIYWLKVKKKKSNILTNVCCLGWCEKTHWFLLLIFGGGGWTASQHRWSRLHRGMQCWRGQRSHCLRRSLFLPTCRHRGARNRVMSCLRCTEQALPKPTRFPPFSDAIDYKVKNIRMLHLMIHCRK